MNLHFGLPHKNGLRDDIQALWSSSALDTFGYDMAVAVRDFPYTLITTGLPYCADRLRDVPAVSTAARSIRTIPVHRGSTVSSITSPSDRRSRRARPISRRPTTTISRRAREQRALLGGAAQRGDVGQQRHRHRKLQYTHALSSNAYLRVFGYSFYSDWLINSPEALALSKGAYDYELDTHTAGGEVQFSDQITDKNLLTVTANYTTANVIRFNNSTVGTASPIGYWSGSGST